MSVLPIDRVRGERLVERVSPATLDQARRRAPLDLVLREANKPAREVRYRLLLGREVAEVELADGAVLLHDAETGKLLPPLTRLIHQKCPEGLAGVA